MAPTVADVMTPNVHTVAPQTRVADLLKLIADRRVRHVPVVDAAGAVLGVISDRDLYGRALGPLSWLGADVLAEQLQELRAQEVMTSELVTVPPSTPLADAARVLLDEQLGCLPVVEDGRLVGILTSSDFVRLHAR